MHRTNHTSTRRGVTLIEVMIASALLVLAAAGMMDIAVRVMREHARCSRQDVLDSETALVIEALVRDLSRARKAGAASASGKVLSLLVNLPGPGAKAVETPVEYALDGTRILRTNAPSKTRSWDGAQVLAVNASRFVVERRGNLLRVEVICSSETRAERFESVRKTDFYVGGLEE